MSVLSIDGSLEPLGYEQKTSLSSVQSLSPPQGARLALIQALGQAVRWRDDSTDPSATTGVQLDAGQDFWYTGSLSAIRFIESASAAELNVAYYTG